MADIFISYAKNDREKVEPIALALKEQGWSVFWDRAIPGGKTWDEVIEEELDAAKCVVVVWSKISIKSRWVRAEAEEGLHRNILVPVSIEDVKIPLLFRPIQSVRLIHWEGDSNHPQFVKLISDLSPILGPSPLKIKEAEQLRTEEENRRKEQEEQERKAAEEKRHKEQELKRKAEEEHLKKEAEARRKAEEERKKKEIEEQRKIEEERKRKEEEQKRIEAVQKAEEEHKQKEAEAKRRADEEQQRKEKEERKRREVKTEVKTDKPEPDAKATIEPVSSEPRKTGKALKFGAAGFVIVLLIVGIWWWVSSQQANEVRQELEKLKRQALNLENAISNLDKLEQIEELTKQRDTLSHQVAGISERATEVGFRLQLESLQKRLKQIQIKLANKEKELIAARKAKIFVATVPENATVKILNINEQFKQGMELEPGEYRLQASSEGYEPQQRSIKLDPGEEKQINFTLEKIIQKAARLIVITVPENATVRILNIKPKFVQGMELEPGNYHVEVAAEGYETKRQWIDLAAGQEIPFRFELVKIEVAEPISPQKTITNSIGMKFVLIPAGKYIMGSPPDEPGRSTNERQHEVNISKAFFMQTTEVSQGQWKRVMGDNPSNLKFCGDDCPVEQVSWHMAQKFISKLNQIENTKKYRLPTEAEWEYSCRAGTITPFFTGDCISTDQANYNGRYSTMNCPNGDQRKGTVKVGSFQSNAWGLFDMHGNVYEWCQDWYGDYPSNSVIDPMGPDKGEYRVLRGGSWFSEAEYLRSASRIKDFPTNPYSFTSYGFRVACDL